MTQRLKAVMPTQGDVEMDGKGDEDIRVNGRVIPVKSDKLKEAFSDLRKVEKEIE